MGEISLHYPGIWVFLEKKYGIKKSQVSPQWTLAQLCKQFELPPAQILFMEVQLDAFPTSIEEITALEVQRLIQNETDLAVLDVREAWERKFGSLPGSIVLDSSLLESIKTSWPKPRTIILYCHFGVRSKDAAHFLANEGFLQIYVLKGGIDAWSVQVDPTLPRYTGAYC